MPASPFAVARRVAPGALMTLALAAIAPEQARADSIEARAWSGAGAAVALPSSFNSRWGPSAQLGLQLGFADFWALYGGVDGSYHFADSEAPEAITGAFGVADLFLGVRYNLDVFRYVPFVGVAAVGYASAPPVSGDQPAPGAGAKLTLGLEWRPDRDWSVSGLVEAHSVFSGLTDFGLYGMAGLNVGYHWRL